MTRLLTTRDVAGWLAVSEDYVRSHAAEFGAVRIADRGPLRFHAERVERALEARRVQAAPPTSGRRPGPRRKAPGVDLLPLPGETR